MHRPLKPRGLAAALRLSMLGAALAFGSLTAVTPAMADDPAPPTVKALLDGYTLKPGLDQALYNKLQVISVQYVGDVLKVTGTYQEKAVFGGQAN